MQQSIVADLGLTEEGVRSNIRDGLLTMWKEWELFGDRYFSDKLWDLLREDINLAFKVLAVVSGKPVDLRDPYFDPSDRMPRSWARPREVLPFEFLEAREDFSFFAPIYLKAPSVLLPPPHQLDEAKLIARFSSWWKEVPPFQRFCLNLHRLHRHYNMGGRKTRVLLEQPTPIDFLLLTALSAERILLHLYLKVRPAEDAPSFGWLLRWTSDRITAHLGIPSINAVLESELPKTVLKKLTSVPKNPFSSARGLPKGTLSELLLAAFWDLAVMRHYAAHHDVLDDELVAKAWGGEPLAAMVLIVLLALES